MLWARSLSWLVVSACKASAEFCYTYRCCDERGRVSLKSLVFELTLKNWTNFKEREKA